MDEDGVRALAREEIRKAFTEMREGARWYASGYGELTESAAHVAEEVANRVIASVTPPEPEPVNPFAPKHTAQDTVTVLDRALRGMTSPAPVPPCGTQFEAGPCAGTWGHPGDCTPLADDIPSAPAPEPVNPFAPKHTAQEWADRIKELIRQAEADGYKTWCDADGSVSSTAPIVMRIGTDASPIEEDPTVWRLQ